MLWNPAEPFYSGGSYKSHSIIYAALCTFCPSKNTYVGKTVSTLATRINGHRAKFYSLLRENAPLTQLQVDDTNTLGAHLIKTHAPAHPPDFDSTFKFSILAEADPPRLRQLEQLFIEKLKTLYPFGLNQIDSVQYRPS